MVNAIERVEVGRTKAGPRVARLLGILAAAGALAATPSCSFIVDSNANQCEADADCTNPEYPTCSAEKLCIKPAVVIECTTNQQCLTNDPNKICRKSDSKCVPLKTNECTLVDGDPSRDDSFMIGAVLPTTGADDIFGKPVELAIQLALSEIKNELSGIPTSTPGVNRPVLFIGCSDNSDLEDDTARKAATHLSEVLQVPAIIGEAFSGSTLTIANDVTIKNGTLLISPAATSDTITSLSDNDLVWRTSPPDKLQAAALKLYVPEVEQLVRANFTMEMMPPDTKVKVAILHNTDSYGVGLADGVLSGSDSPPLQINGVALNDPSNAANYKRTQYSDLIVDEQLAAANELAETFHPHIVLLFGFSEAISIMSTIEDNWTGGTIRPRYVFPDAVLSSDLSNAVGADASLRSRVTGTIPGTQNQQFIGFVDRYNLKYSSEKNNYPANTFGAAGGYDAVFLLAYATATLNGMPETGKNLAEGLKLLSEGASIEAGAKNVSKGFTELLTKGTMNYNGASGPLDFNPATGEAQSDIQIWCLPEDGGMTGDGRSSGRFYEAASKKLAGTFAACNP
jgi:branched-chain amino acid transport system substrate-binding protein